MIRSFDDMKISVSEFNILDISSVNVYQCTDSDHPDIQAIQVGKARNS